eukprot:7390962-Pyramimonas_sp.AAC.2
MSRRRDDEMAAHGLYATTRRRPAAASGMGGSQPAARPHPLERGEGPALAFGLVPPGGGCGGGGGGGAGEEAEEEDEEEEEDVEKEEEEEEDKRCHI